jgi:PAS domain S-box-containing protein
MDVSLNASAVRDKDGKITHSRSIWRDITNSKRAEEALKESESKYRNLIDQAWDAIFVIDSTGKMLLVNEQACQMLGYTQEELIRLNIADTYPVEERAIAAQRIATVQRGDYLRYERSIVRKDGTIFPVEVAIGMLPDGMIQGIVRNITERKQAEEALRRAEENFRRSLDDSPLGVRIATAEGETIYANRAILDIYSIEELNTTSLMKRYTPESYAEFQIRREKRKRGDYGPSEYEVSIVKKDGEIRYLKVFRKEVLWNGERQFQVIYQDITERRRVENEIQAVARFPSENPNPVLRIAWDGTLLYVNTAGLSQLSDRDLKVGQGVPSKMRDVVSEALNSGKVRLLDIEHYGRVYSFFVAPIADAGYANLYGRDITERKKTEKALRTSREQLRALAGRLQAVREEERTQIAREIHDELGGAFTGLKIDFSLLTRAALKIENGTVRASLLAGMDSMTKFIDATIHTVRRIAMELRPGVLDDLGLVAALEWQLKDFEKRTGIRCEFFPPVEDISFEADLSTALFRIFQEALTNVARHSGATEVRVRLCADADSSTLEIKDNGKGIEKEKTLSSKSLGLLGMRERAQMFGGRITVTGTPGIGTKVTVEIPPEEKRKMDRDQGGTAG